jgi:hypothetical protein
MGKYFAIFKIKLTLAGKLTVAIEGKLLVNNIIVIK